MAVVDNLFWVALGSVILSLVLLFVALFAMDEDNEDNVVKWRIAMPVLPVFVPIFITFSYYGIQYLRSKF